MSRKKRVARGTSSARLRYASAIAAIERSDPVNIASAELPALRNEIGETVSLIAWGERGPTIRRTEGGPLRIRPGTILSLTDSASGALFRAFLPAAQSVPSDADLETERMRRQRAREARDARRCSMTRAVGSVLPGVSALVVPLVDRGGRMTAALAAYGRTESFDARWDGVPATVLRRFTARLDGITR